MTSRPLDIKNEPSKSIYPTQLRILIVDDEIRLSRFISMVLQHSGYLTTTCKSVHEAKQALTCEQEWALVLTDLVMPHENGFELVHWLTQNCPDLPVVIMTAYSNGPIELKAEQMGVSAVLLKPFTLDILRNTIATYAKFTPSQSYVSRLH